MKRIGIALLVTVFALAAAPAPPAAPEEQAVRARVEEYFAALSRGDLTAVEAAYWPSAVITTRMRAPSGEARVQGVTPQQYAGWFAGQLGAFDYIRFRVLRCEVRRYLDLADAWVVMEIRERPSGAEERLRRAAATLHLVRGENDWRISAHAWTMESPGQPLAAAQTPRKDRP